MKNNNESNSFRVIAKKNKLYLVTRDDNATLNDIYVNGFIINGEQTWVPVERRINLRMSINSYLALQIPTMTKIWNNKEYTFTTDEWDLYLNQVEVYASECLNVTLRHAAYVQTMTNIDDVEAFDVTADYPAMPEFTTDDYSND